MPIIRFKAAPYKIASRTVVALPKIASAKLPSRGAVLVKGTVDGIVFQTLLQP